MSTEQTSDISSPNTVKLRLLAFWLEFVLIAACGGEGNGSPHQRFVATTYGPFCGWACASSSRNILVVGFPFANHREVPSQAGLLFGITYCAWSCPFDTVLSTHDRFALERGSGRQGRFCDLFACQCRNSPAKSRSNLVVATQRIVNAARMRFVGQATAAFGDAKVRHVRTKCRCAPMPVCFLHVSDTNTDTNTARMEVVTSWSTGCSPLLRLCLVSSLSTVSSGASKVSPICPGCRVCVGVSVQVKPKYTVCDEVVDT